MTLVSFLKKWESIIGISLWVFGALVPFLIRDPFPLHVFNVIFLGISLALAWAILARTGYISFAHNAFLGIGAYTSVLFVIQLHTPYLVGFLAAGIISAGFAVILGAIILRLKGIFFVLSTFCFAQIMLLIFRMAEPITGGVSGIRDIPAPVLPLLGSIKSHEGFYILFYFYATMVVIFTKRIFCSNLGREFKAIGEDMFATESLGIRTTRKKIVAFAISSVIVGFSGSLYAHYTGFVSDTSFETGKAMEPVIYNAVGGMGSIVGPILGAFVMVPMPELFRRFVDYQVALYGLILILILRFFPAGIWGTAKGIIKTPSDVEKSLRSKSLRLSSELVKGFLLEYRHTIVEKKERLLECNGISRHFGGLAALTDVSFDIRQGDILGIVGPNGAGKSTLYNIITGIFSPSQGNVVFEGENITGLKPSKINRLGISRVYQATVLYGEASVKENISRALVGEAGFNGLKDMLRLEKKKHEWMIARTRELLKLFSLESVEEELARNLPYGFQRLLGLAMALAPQPKLLLLDEPVAGMSEEEIEMIASILRKLHQNGMTMIIVEHNVNFVMGLCPRIIVLDYGKKIAEGTPKEIRKNTKVIEAYLGS